MKKAISLFISVVFLFAQAVPVSAQSLSAERGELLPEKLGKVVSSHIGSLPGEIYFIQDAHLNTSAQINISEIIGHLVRTKEVQLIGVEGSAGKFDTSEFQKMPFNEIKKTIFQKLLKEKQITGPEYYAYIKKGRKETVVGIDDIPTYIKNIRVYTDSLSWREKALENLDLLKLNINNLKAKVFNKELRNFDGRLQDLYESQKNYSDYLRFVLSEAEKQGIGLEKYQNLNQFKNLQVTEETVTESIDPARLMKEIRDVTLLIKEKLYLSEDEKYLDEISERINFLKQFFKFQITPDEFRAYQADPNTYDLSGLKESLAALADKYHVLFRQLSYPDFDWKEAVSQLPEFYRLAQKRDRALANNMTQEMRRERAGAGILVAGGFHSRGIQEELRKKDISFHVIQPRLAVDLKDRDAYRKRMESYATYFETAAPYTRAAVTPLSKVKPIQSPMLDTRQTVHEFWRDEIYTPYVTEVHRLNIDDPRTVYIAGDTFAGTIMAADLGILMFDSGLELESLEKGIVQFGDIVQVDDPAFQEAAQDFSARSLGEGEPIKLTLIHLTDLISAKGKIVGGLGIETLAGHLEAVYNRPETDIPVDVKTIHIQKEMNDVQNQKPLIKRGEIYDETVKRIIEKIMAEMPDAVGLSLWPGSLEQAKMIYDALQQIPEETRPEFVVGGVLATYNRERLLEDFPQGLIIPGKGELPLEILVEQLYKRKTGQDFDFDLLNLTDEENQIISELIYVKRPAAHVQIGGWKVIKWLAEKVGAKDKGGARERFGQFSGLPRRDFIHDVFRTGSVVHLETSRGCRGHCTYCTQGGRTPVLKPMSQIMEEISQINNSGVKKINIVDDVFLGGDIEKMKEFADEIIARKGKGELDPDLVFYITTRADTIYNPLKTKEHNQNRKDVFKKLRLAGVMTLNIGLESGARKQIVRYGKGIRIQTVEKALSALKEIEEELKDVLDFPQMGIEAGFMMFDPMITLKEIQENIDFLRKTGMEYYINYPFQQLRLQEGTPFVSMARNWDLLHEAEYNKNWLVYNYHYENPEVARVVYQLKHWEPSVFRFFYSLKQLIRAMPLPETSVQEHAYLTEAYSGLNSIQLDLLQELVSAEYQDDPETARDVGFKKINETLRQFYLGFLRRLENRQIDTDREIFRQLIIRSLIINVITDEGRESKWDQGTPFSADEIFKKLPKKDRYQYPAPYDLSDIVAGLRDLEQDGLVVALEENLYQITGDFFIADFQFIDLPKGAKPTKAQRYYYNPARSRSINVVFTGAPMSGRTEIAEIIAEKYKIPMINIWDLVEEWRGSASKKLPTHKRSIDEHRKKVSEFDKKLEVTKEDEERADLEKYKQKAEENARVSQMLTLQVESSLRAYEGEFSEVFDYEILKKIVNDKIENTDLSRGFVLVGGMYLEKLYQDVFLSRGIDFDHVLYLDPESELIEERLSGYPEDVRGKIRNRINLQSDDLRRVYAYFDQKGKLIRISISREHPYAAETVFHALHEDVFYILHPEDVSYQSLFEREVEREQDRAGHYKVDILQNLLKSSHESVLQAFQIFKENFQYSDHTNTTIANPKQQANASLSDQTLQLILINAYKASDEDKLLWVKFIFGIDAARLALKRKWLPGFAYVIAKAKDKAPHIVNDILKSRTDPTWPIQPDDFNDSLTTQNLRMTNLEEIQNKKIVQFMRAQELLMLPPPLEEVATREQLEGLKRARKIVDDFQKEMKWHESKIVPTVNEAVMMLKPGIKLTKEGMLEILRRMNAMGQEVMLIKSVPGHEIKSSDWVDRQYHTTYQYAKMGIDSFFLSDFENLRNIYENDEFERIFERNFYEMDIFGAYQLIDQDILTPEEIIELWSAGYDDETSEVAGKPKRILVINDTPAQRRQMAEYISLRKGLEPVMAASAEEALEKIEEGESFDLVFAEFRLKGEMNGLQFADKLKAKFEGERRQGPPVVLISGFSIDDEISDVMQRPESQRSIVDVAQRPIGDVGVERLLARHLKGYRRFNTGMVDGINRIGDRKYVMPVRHPKVNGGDPFFLLNGHHAAVKDMYEDDETVVHILLVRSMPIVLDDEKIYTHLSNLDWQWMRTHVIGDTNPASGFVGSVRRDANDGIIPIKKGGVVSPMRNVAHYSEGALEAFQEQMEWFSDMGVAPDQTSMGKELIEAGYSQEEIEYFLSNPVFELEGGKQSLFSRMSQMDVDKSIEFLLEFFPPFYSYQQEDQVVRPSVSFTEFQEIRQAYDDGKLSIKGNIVKGKLSSAEAELTHHLPNMAPAERQKNYSYGIEQMKRGKFARVHLSAGTAGRLLGRETAEAARIRGAVPFVNIQDVPEIEPGEYNSFEIQQLITEKLKEKLGVKLPVWIMTSNLNHENTLEHFRDEPRLSTEDIRFFTSVGIPRFNPKRADLEAYIRDEIFDPTRPEISTIEITININREVLKNGGTEGLFKWGPNEISVKTPGHFDTIASLVVSGELARMIDQGIEIVDAVDVANLGTFPDPELYGVVGKMMASDPELGMVQVLVDRNVIHDGVVKSPDGEKIPYRVIVRGSSIAESFVPDEWSPHLQDDGSLLFGYKGEEGLIRPIEEKIDYETGGPLLKLDGVPQIIESIRIPSDFDQSIIDHFSTFRAFIKIDAVLDFYGFTDRSEYLSMFDEKTREVKPAALKKLRDKMKQAHSKLSSYIEIKNVPHPKTGEKRKAAQMVRLLGDLTRLVPTAYIVIDRDAVETITGYVAYKTEPDILANQERAERIIARLVNVKTGAHPLLPEPSDDKDETKGASLGQELLKDLIQTNQKKVNSVVWIRDGQYLESFLKEPHLEMIRAVLRNPKNNITLYLPSVLMEKIPRELKRRNFHLINSDLVSLKEHLNRITDTYESVAFIAPDEIFLTPDLAGFEGYQLVSDKLMGENRPIPNDSGKFIGNYLTTVSFGLLTQGDSYASRFLNEQLVYDSEARAYYIDQGFALSDLLEEWTRIFQGLLAIRKAA